MLVGDDDGTIKLWDLRTKQQSSIFSLKKNEDYISDMITNEQRKHLVCSSGDGSLTTIDIGGRYSALFVSGLFNDGIFIGNC